MRLFNPFDFFFAQDGELNNAVTYLRDCVNSHDTTDVPAAAEEWQPRRIPTSGIGRRRTGALRNSLGELRRRISGH